VRQIVHEAARFPSSAALLKGMLRFAQNDYPDAATDPPTHGQPRSASVAKNDKSCFENV
jgi:hypothetical protein